MLQIIFFVVFVFTCGKIQNQIVTDGLVVKDCVALFHHCPHQFNHSILIVINSLELFQLCHRCWQFC